MSADEAAEAGFTCRSSGTGAGPGDTGDNRIHCCGYRAGEKFDFNEEAKWKVLQGILQAVMLLFLAYSQPT